MASKEDAQAPEATPNLRQRMASAMGDIGRVAKAGKLVSGQTKYDYTKADDIITEVRAALIQHGIVFLSSESGTKRLPDREAHSGSAILSVEVTMEFTLLDTTSDEKLVAHHTGEGMDGGDKAINKAKTAALKYFLQQTFLIPTGDDPEKDDHDIKTKPPVGNLTQAWTDENAAHGFATLAQVAALWESCISAFAGDKAEATKWWEARLKEMGVSKKTMKPEQVTTLTAELLEFAPKEQVEPDPPQEETDIEF